MVRDEADGGRKVNRPRQDGEEERRYKRLAGKSTWFKGSKKGTKKEKQPRKRRGPTGGRGQTKEIDTVMFVPHTPGDVLALLKGGKAGDGGMLGGIGGGTGGGHLS